MFLYFFEMWKNIYIIESEKIFKIANNYNLNNNVKLFPNIYSKYKSEQLHTISKTYECNIVIKLNLLKNKQKNLSLW